MKPIKNCPSLPQIIILHTETRTYGLIARRSRASHHRQSTDLLDRNLGADSFHAKCRREPPHVVISALDEEKNGY